MTSRKTSKKIAHDSGGIKSEIGEIRKRKYEEIKPFHPYLELEYNLDSELIGLDSSKSHNRKRFSR